MPVDSDINLDNPDGISQEDIDIMNREADEIEKLAKNSEANAEKIRKARESIEGLSFAQLNVLDKSLEGVQDRGEGEGGGITMDQLLDFKIEMLKELEKAQEERKENTEKISDEERERKSKESEIEKIKKEVEKIKKQHDKKILDDKNSVSEMHSTMMGIKSNPIAFGKGKALNMLGKLGVWGIVAGFAVEMVQQVVGEVIAEVKSWYKAGGALDKRKIVLDVLKEYNSINYLTKIKSGGVFFTSDAGQDLRQGAPRGAYNTRELRDGHMRFIQLRAGV